MKKICLLIVLCGFLQTLIAQPSHPDESWKTVYRGVPEKINDLVHTRLDAKFDYNKSQLNGKVWITLKPHAYSVDNLQLDAKGMDIHKVQLVGVEKNTPLMFTYDSMNLNISLGKTFKPGDEYKVYIEYTARPDDYKAPGSAAITGAKGLYFVNPDGTIKDQPIQVWTQGETEGTSVWLPTIDKPNQKSTQEMNLTVPDKYVSLSNGMLTGQKKNKDGTRTDTWKMDQPNAPYLFFMGVGDYAVIKDSYKGKEVSYYVEKPYKDVARKIFGNTPEMIKFFSGKLGVEYPWVKYSQMTARDYVSGAMENTTATLHGEWAQQNARQLTDGNRWESVIAHELFHQWFGDLVTCESWSNLTVNESFADFSEILWEEHKRGVDYGQASAYASGNEYLGARSDAGKSLVRYYYADREDMFDNVSYQKGGRILYMLRNFVGEDAFFKSLNTYLTRNRYGNGNARELQQAFEDTTGKDLNWFFTQWYYGTGHPVLNINYTYDKNAKKVSVIVTQTQTTQNFRLPVYIDVYHGDKVDRHLKWVEHPIDTFILQTAQRPDLVNFDAEKSLLLIKTENKTIGEYQFQYAHAKNYVDRIEAVRFASAHADHAGSQVLLQTALKDPNFKLRRATLQSLDAGTINAAMLAEVERVASKDPSTLARYDALTLLGQRKDQMYKPLFIKSLTDSSYAVAGAAYSGLIDLDEAAAVSWLPKLKVDAKDELAEAVKRAEIFTKTDADFNDMYAELEKGDIYEKFRGIHNFIWYLRKVNNVPNFKKGVDLVVSLRDNLSSYSPNIKDEVNDELRQIKQQKEANKTQQTAQAMAEQAKYLEEILRK